MEEKKQRPLPPDIEDILKKPIDPAAVSDHPTRKYLSAIKGIYVVERLNEAFGIGGWFVKNEVIEAHEGDDMIVVKSYLYVPAYNIKILDIFGGNDNADRGDAYKGACTDALTKIGSMLGIAMDVFKGLKDAPTQAKTTPPKAEKPTTGRSNTMTAEQTKLFTAVAAACDENMGKMELMLHSLTEFEKDGKMVGGKRSFFDVSDKAAKVARHKLEQSLKTAL